VTEPTPDNSGPTNVPEGGAGGDSGIGAAPTEPTTTPEPVNTPAPVPAKGRGGCLGGATALIALVLAVLAILVH
jgi:hypothetical protein